MSSRAPSPDRIEERSQLSLNFLTPSSSPSPLLWSQLFTDFFTNDDPTHGYVNYVSKAVAQASNLITSTASSFKMAVDSTTAVATGRGRNSIRIVSKDEFGDGLYVLDVNHMPVGCGTVRPRLSFTDLEAKGRTSRRELISFLLLFSSLFSRSPPWFRSISGQLTGRRPPLDGPKEERSTSSKDPTLFLPPTQPPTPQPSLPRPPPTSQESLSLRAPPHPCILFRSVGLQSRWGCRVGRRRRRSVMRRRTIMLGVELSWGVGVGERAGMKEVEGCMLCGGISRSE